VFSIFAPHATDFYKTGHPFMFPDGLEELYGNFTPRGDKNARVLPDFDHKIVWVGLQPVLKYLLIDCWNTTFFNVPKDKAVAKYKRRLDLALGESAPPVDHIAELWDLQYLPVKIKALPEGSRVDIRVPPCTFKSTHPRFAWVEQYLETQVSAELWKPLTTATTAFEFRRLITKYATETGGNLPFVLFQGHDFSMRGMSGITDATASGAAHLMVFRGTDTVSSLDFLEDFYRPAADEFLGGSVPATEHAVSSSNIIAIAAALAESGIWNGWTAEELDPRDRAVEKTPLLELAETAFLKHMLVNKFPKGIISSVSDTYDFWAVITRIARHLKSDILSREGKLVFRPDSGDPVKIVVGDPEAPEESPEHKGAVECLWEIFGGTTNDLGYRTLNSHVGLIYGDSISLERAEQIMAGLKRKRFASDNIVFGIGSYTYQYVTRDTFGTAIKATHAIINGRNHELFKDPKTDSGVKKSARGYLCVEREGDKYLLRDCQSSNAEGLGELRVVFEDGLLFNQQTVGEIRGRIDAEIERMTETSTAAV
jgi:nicotinamide phosphoribosyltransferase